MHTIGLLLSGAVQQDTHGMLNTSLSKSNTALGTYNDMWHVQ